MSGTDTALARLADLSETELRIEWRRVWRRAPPDLTRDLLLRGVAWKLQAKASRGLSTAAKRQLKAFRVSKSGTNSRGPTTSHADMRPGTRLVRRWNGRSIVVTRATDAWLWEDRTYRSLSKIATEVTGTRWSGPRFFGLGASG